MTLNTDVLDTFLINTGALIILSLAVRWHGKNRKKIEEEKLREKVLSSPNTSWKKVAKVKGLYCYPLKSGKAKSAEECFFGEYGIVVNQGVRPIEDRMFIAYDEKTKKSITAGAHIKLLIVKCCFVSGNRAKFEVNNMPPLEFELPDQKSEPVSLIMWIGETVNGIDCGPEASKWFSQYLIGKDSGVRLAMRIPNNRRNVTEGVWEPFAKAYTHLRNEDSGLFAYLASYMLLSQDSVNDLNKRLEKSIPHLQLRPNVVVEGCEPYAEDNWEWIKIGDSAIIRRIKLCTRCAMTRVDPETGIPDPKYEVLKTLRNYRKLKDPELDKLDFHSPAMGVYCGLYRTGNVRLDDDVYVYQGG